MDEQHRVRVERSPRRVRALFAGQFVADSTRAWLVWERPHYPTYYLPAEDVRADLLVAGESHDSPVLGHARVFTLEVGGRVAPDAVRWYDRPLIPELARTLRLEWAAMDAWFEEDEEVFVHPKDPYTRVDLLQSSRHLRVEIGGVTVAESQQPRILYETGLPPRYYLPKTSVRMDLLTPTAKTTRCPYKGSAQYYALALPQGPTHDDIVWWYEHPTLESAKIAGYVCFYDERVDLYVDGVLQNRPRETFS